MKTNYKKTIIILSIILIARTINFAQTWSPVGGGIYGQVLCMAVYNGELYVGGSFGGTATITANKIVKWNGSTWSAVGTGMNNDVLALTVYKGELYAGGRFTTAGGVAANRIAKWNGTTWSAVGTGVGMDDRIRVLVGDTINNILYAGGDFTTADGVSAQSIAKWDGVSWSGTGCTSYSVEGMTMYNGNLYAGASMIINSSVRGFLSYNGTSWSPMASGYDCFGLTHTLYTYNNEVYIGGSNQTVHNAGVYDTANYVAKYNGSRFDSLSSGMDTVGIPFGTQGSGAGVKAFAAYNNEIYAGGDFTSASKHSAKHIAKWNGTSWDSVSTGMDNIVRTLCTYNGDLYAGGNFTVAGGVTTYYIAKFGSGATGIENNSKTKNVSVYPNPTSNYITINTNENIKTVSIYNSLGEEVLVETSNSFSIAQLPIGIYTLKINTIQSTTVTRIIKE